MTTEEITPQIQKQLNFSALLLKKHAHEVDLESWFGFDVHNEWHVKAAKRLLKYYGIHSGLDLRGKLFEYENGIIASTTFEKLAASLRLDTTSSFEAKYKSLDNVIQEHQYTLAWKYRFSLKDQKLKGYEMAKYVFLMRLGGILNYMELEEITLRLTEAEALLKNTFTSWGEFHRNVCIGDEFINGSGEQDRSSFPGILTLWECYQRMHITYSTWFKEW
ncbi:DUF1266 domain-containing protein [Zunongwangia sp. HGR-M22]|uniref:DUF1266 domain-containing protein n=1 Tax=Zunongwangia sp. HGR-M22 TaxID=3015168 RepID=UPI0022DE1C6D|nr:DUF1266 domain-containing protein [Zunongwangia sp. HGR-M22]WBL26999.1 DUF1266 domain-containing protein [Zunongwangia sp. HGR-M22]